MALVNRRKISLYDEAKAGFSSLVQQTAQVGLGLLVILLLTGGNPPSFIVALSFFGGIGFVAWREKQRLSQSEQLLEEQQDFNRSVVVEKQQLTQFEQSLEEQHLNRTLLDTEKESSAEITINNNLEEILYKKNTAIVTESSEKFLYNKNEVRITRTLLEYKGTEYPTRNISKVKLEKKEPNDQSLIGFITGLKQISCPNKAQSRFISEEYVTILIEPLEKTIRHCCPKCF